MKIKKKIIVMLITAAMMLQQLPVAFAADTAPMEQFSLTPGSTYYFNLSTQSVPGTVNGDLPDTSLKWVPFTYVGTVNAYSRTVAGASTEQTVSVNNRSLFVADYNVTKAVSWDELNSNSLIFGKSYSSSGVSYKLRSLSVGSNITGSGESLRGLPLTNEWDGILNKNTNFIKNTSGLYSWGQDTNLSVTGERYLRGNSSPRGVWTAGTSWATNTCFRPALEITSAAGTGLKTVTFDMGVNGTLGGGSLSSATVVYTGTLTLPEITTVNGFNYTEPGPGRLSWYDGKTYYTPGTALSSLPSGTTLKAGYDGVIKEQFTLTPGGTYYFDLTAQGIPGTVNAALPDTSLKWVPFTYAGTVNAYSRTTEGISQKATVSVNDRSLFVADYNVTNTVSWNDLNSASLIFGKSYDKGNISYKLRSLSMGSGSNNKTGDEQRCAPESNEWDQLLNKKAVYIKNSTSIGSWGQDTSVDQTAYRTFRGADLNRGVHNAEPVAVRQDIGFRPTLEIKSTAGTGLKTVTFDMGSNGTLGSGSLSSATVVYTGTLTLPGITPANGFNCTGAGAGTLGWYDGLNFYKPGDKPTLAAGTTLKLGYGGIPPKITTTSLPGGEVGSAYSQPLAMEGSIPAAWSIVSGALPPGLTLSNSGVISGTPDAVGTSTFVVGVDNSSGSHTQELSIKVSIIEQFSLAPGGTYYFDLSSQKLPGTVNAALPDKSLKWVPFTYVGTLKASIRRSDNAMMPAGLFNLFVADYNVVHSANWFLHLSMNNGLIFGKGYVSRNVPYVLRSLSCGSESNGDSGSAERGMPASNEWDRILDKDTNYIKNYAGMYSYGQDEVPSHSGVYCAVRGNDKNTARNFYQFEVNNFDATVGFRPALELPKPATLGADGLKSVTFDMGADGTIGTKGSLCENSLTSAAVVYTGKLTIPAITQDNGFNYTGSGTGTLGWYDGSTFYEPGATVTLATGTKLTPGYSNAASITGPTTLTLIKDYSATSTSEYTITGTAPVTVSKTSGDAKITWNDTTKKLDIAAGLAVGSYPVTLTASNGALSDATLNFTLTVNAAVTHTVTFVDWDSSELKKETVNDKAKATAPANPVRNGYTFTGWDRDFSSVTSDLTVKAQYTENTAVTHTVTFVDWDSSELKKETVNDKAKATAPANPVREGYTFTGWDKDFSSVTSDLTVTAQYTENTAVTHTVTFVDWDGKVLKTETVNDGAAATAPANPSRNGYTFTGWDIEFSKVTSDLTVTAQYSQNAPAVTHTVTFKDWDSSELKKETVNDKAKATAPANPVREGYTFTGWDKDFSSVTSDLTVTAEYSKNAAVTHIVTFKDWDGKVLKTETVNGGATATAPANPFRNGYTFTGWDKNFSNVTSDLTVKAQYSINNSNNSGNNGGGTPNVTPPVETPKPEITIRKDTEAITATTTAKTTTGSAGNASASVTESQVSDAVKKSIETASKESEGTAARVELKVQAPADSKSVETSLPKKALNEVAASDTAALTISTPVAAITFDNKSLDTISGQAGGDVKITAAKADVRTLSEETRQAVGDRPVYNFSVTSGDKTISQFGGSVTVAVPYTPKPGEDPNAIVIYYINAQGKPEMVSNCKYNPATGTISFATNHFSQYAVGYNKVSFKDVAEDAWYSKAVGFIAARGITTGTGNGLFNPGEKLTRGQFIVMVLKAYGISPDQNPTENFSDAGSTYYSNYLATAKKLGISGGVGNNRFAPDNQITRQEMFVLLYNALKATGKVPEVTGAKTLVEFSDGGQVASWAKDAMTYFVQTGTISGNGGKLSPVATTSRAEMAQVLYNLLSK